MIEQDEEGMMWASRLVSPDELTPLKYADSDWRGFRAYKKDEWIYSDSLKVQLPNHLIRVVYLKTLTGETTYLKEGVLQKLPKSFCLLVRNLLSLILLSTEAEGKHSKKILLELGCQRISPLLSQSILDIFMIPKEKVKEAGLDRNDCSILPVVAGPGTSITKSKKDTEIRNPDFSKVKNDTRYFLKCVTIDW